MVAARGLSVAEMSVVSAEGSGIRGEGAVFVILFVLRVCDRNAANSLLLRLGELAVQRLRAVGEKSWAPEISGVWV